MAQYVGTFPYVDTLSRDALYQLLYPQSFYELIRYNPRSKRFNRHILARSFKDIKTHADMCNERGFDSYISSYGWDIHPDTHKRGTKDMIVDKIWFDFDTDEPEKLEDVLVEVEKFSRNVEDYFKCKNYIQFSGAKGYHIWVPMANPMRVPQETIIATAEWMIDKWNPEYVCEGTLRNPMRPQRLPYTKNTKSGKECKPISNIYAKSTNINTIVQRMQYEQQDELNRKLIRSEANKIVAERLAKFQETVNTGASVAITNWDVMDKVFEKVYSPGERKGDKYIVNCPFHDDNNASAFYTDKLFHCSACGISVGSYNFLVKHVGMQKGRALRLIKESQ